ncbi:hypothetical protein LY76DRAFT_85629 [Colletotrichum caudatum]|nr:hypothetical protein LY76DRAFT_85629 [Colletotrichum caudatum]
MPASCHLELFLMFLSRGAILGKSARGRSGKKRPATKGEFCRNCKEGVARLTTKVKPKHIRRDGDDRWRQAASGRHLSTSRIIASGGGETRRLLSTCRRTVYNANRRRVPPCHCPNSIVPSSRHTTRWYPVQYIQKALRVGGLKSEAGRSSTVKAFPTTTSSSTMF